MVLATPLQYRSNPGVSAFLQGFDLARDRVERKMGRSAQELRDIVQQGVIQKGRGMSGYFEQSYMA
jgi:hypothetical protein